MAIKKTGAKVTKKAAAKSAGKTPAKGAPKPAAKKPAAKKPAKPTAKPAAKPAAKIAAKPAAKIAAKIAAKPAAKVAAKPAAKIATPAPAKPPAAKPTTGLSAATIESTFGVTLQPRYRNFIETGEYARYNDRMVSNVPGLGFSPQVVFDAPKLLTIFRTNGVKIESKIPLAAFRGNPELLTVDVSDPACPVGVWDSGSFFHFHPSLDALLASLQESPKTPLHESEMDDDLADDGD